LILYFISFTNISSAQTGPHLISNYDTSINLGDCDNTPSNFENFYLLVPSDAFDTDCTTGSNTTITDDCNGCQPNCTDPLFVTYTVVDECNISADFVFEFFTDNGGGNNNGATGPYIDDSLDSDFYQNYCSDSQPFLDYWFEEIEFFYFYTDCMNGDSDLTFSNDCNGCTLNCNETITVTFTVTDDCGLSTDAEFTFSMDDGDNIPAAIDNCPDDYNSGQEDFDGDGIVNTCDPENIPANSVEIENNLYLNEISSGVILKAQDGGCWFLTVNNNGSVKSHSVDCPN